jgi:hypothetical protein
MPGYTGQNLVYLLRLCVWGYVNLDINVYRWHQVLQELSRLRSRD